MKVTSARGRAAAAFVASMALVGSAAAITTGPAQSAESTGDCATPYPVAELTDGEAVTGLTVVEGTEPTEFTGTYIGKLTSGIAPGLDMLMFEMDFADDRLDDVGIWQGMSGSPVYAADGRLIGAVAYGLSWGPSLVAGVTPYEDMDDYMGAEPPTTIKVGAHQARTVASASDVTARQAGQGFAQLPMPMAYSGISQQRLTKMEEKGPKYLKTRDAVAAGAATSGAATAGDLVAGGNLGAAASYGDVTMGGVGTVTSVCDSRLVGFGHPMTFGGQTTLGMMPADAVYVHGDKVGPGFKLANLGLPAGTITDDHLTGISGDLGVLPAETDVSSTVSYADRSRTGVSHSLSEDYDADVTFSQILASHDRVVDGIQPGSETATFAVTGTDAEGTPFDIAFGDRYVSQFDIAFEGIWDVADAVYGLSQMDGVTIDAVTATAEVTDSTASWRLRGLEARQHGKWVNVTRRTKVVTSRGSTLRLRVQLANGAVTKRVRLQVAVPRRARRSGTLQVQGGSSMWNNAVYRADTPAEMEAALEEGIRNDQVTATLTFPKRGRDLTVSDVSRPLDLVVRGNRWSQVRARR